jgi:phosphatidylglycerophosphate synthase
VTDGPGTLIGPYKLLEQIGEGSVGVVFMAEQLEPIRRKVAVKMLKRGMDTRQAVARFEAERQALALMDHPNIVQIKDGGTTASGQPYFVMELIEGAPITDYCDEHRLTLRQRLELFIPLCRAVQHAHHKGIIHRDLKPADVLVARNGAGPVVKLLDFGIARAAGQPLTDKTLFTGFAQMVGTPPYMSPEQAGQTGLDVDTRSDIYSLGVLLYELLTGTTPFDKERFRDASQEEIRRIICEEAPPTPSMRLAAAEEPASIAARRGATPRNLFRGLSGEVERIIMKCLDKDRNRRYHAASELAEDIERHLRHEPGSLAWTPNAITLLRLLLGVAFPWFPEAWRLPVIVAAALTDGLDGQLSRWLGAESRLGKVLDPIADKVFFGVVAVTLTVAGTITLGELLLIGLRDVIVCAGAAAALLRDGAGAWRDMPPRVLGKAATVAQFAFLAAVLLAWEAGRPWLIASAAAVSGLAGVDYVLAYLRVRRRSRPAPSGSGPA